VTCETASLRSFCAERNELDPLLGTLSRDKLHQLVDHHRRAGSRGEVAAIIARWPGLVPGVRVNVS